MAPIKCYFSEPMRTLSAIFTLAAVVAFAVVPYFTDWHPHYLGDRAEEAAPASGQGNANGSVHYEHCHWLQGTGGIQAVLAPATIALGSASFTSWVFSTPRPCFRSFIPAFSSRAPPLFLS